MDCIHFLTLKLAVQSNEFSHVKVFQPKWMVICQRCSMDLDQVINPDVGLNNNYSPLLHDYFI